MMKKMKMKLILRIAAACFAACLSAQGRAAALSAGDVVLSDGSAVPYRLVQGADAELFPVAVVAGTNADGSAVLLGTKRSPVSLPWALEGSEGHGTKFSAIACGLKGGRNSAGGAAAENAEFSGAADGSGSWQEVCARDKTGTSERTAERSYPALFFAHSYGAQFSLPGEYASGWHLPSIAEICLIYKNRRAVNEALRHLHRLDAALSMDGLGAQWYWSSSQSDSRAEYAWFVHFMNGYAGECPKDFTNLHAVAVRVRPQ